MTTKPRYCLHVCDGPSCGVTHDSDRLVELARRTIADDETLRATVVIRSYTCFGRCDDGPNTFVQTLQPGDDPDVEPDPEVFERERAFYPGMDEVKLVRVLKIVCGEGRPIEELVDDY